MKVRAHKHCSVGVQGELPEGELLPFLLWISRNLKFQSHMESPIGSVLRYWGQGSGERGGCWLCLCQSRDLETGRLWLPRRRREKRVAESEKYNMASRDRKPSYHPVALLQNTEMSLCLLQFMKFLSHSHALPAERWRDSTFWVPKTWQCFCGPFCNLLTLKKKKKRIGWMESWFSSLPACLGKGIPLSELQFLQE